MKAKSLFVALLLIGIASHGQEITIKTNDGKEHVITIQATEKDKQENDSIKLSNLLEKFKLYNSIFKEEYQSLEKYTDADLNTLMTKSAISYKYKRDSIYDIAIKLKREYLKAGKKKENLDKYFPDDISFTEASKNCCETKEEKKEEKKDSNIEEDKFMYLNAADFDFSSNKLGYVGHINFYSPPTKKYKFGFNTGILKINYSNNDSITRYRNENVLINPLDILQVGSSYSKQYNQYKTKISNTSYSIYSQLLFRLMCENKTRIFLHAHAELLISKLSIATSIATIQTETITINTSDEIPERASPFLVKEDVDNQNILSGYFGGGVTFDLLFAKKSSLFFQPTFGVTTNYPQVASVNDQERIYYRLEEDRNWNGFYLIRSYYRQFLADGSELILGADIRGMLPYYNPYYSLYIGLNISIEKITELFK
ncbi:hypothetical protein [Flavobacterium soli]|uniref:hypothetical protein n=1 Tax=Flavobacterium soli TaxID=344881 RepID=UPI000404C363|nr:hypothetical protein [Flavobacterium soli]